MKRLTRFGNIREWSISTRLSLWYSLSILILLGAFASITYFNFHLTIHSDFDQHLRHETSQLLPLLTLESSDPRFETATALNSTAYETTGNYATYVRLISADNRILMTSPNFKELASLGIRLPEEIGETTLSREWGETPLRTLYHPLIAQDGSLRGWLEVSGFEWAVHLQLMWLARTYLLGILVSTVLAFVGGYLLARRALRPVDEITRAAKDIRATDLGARLPTRFGVNDEITRLAETINDLLGRLEESIKREHRFISNATHELITPLTTLRGELDLARTDRVDQETLEVLNLALNDIDRMGHIIRSLLTLSRVERLTSSPRLSVDVGELCREHLERFRDRAEVNGVELTQSSDPGIFIFADPVHVGTVIDNLIDNALKYTPRGGSVHVRVEADRGDVRISVEDTGHGFTTDTADHMFDRFFRADDANIQKKSGSGLGLSIARAITRAYGGEVSGSSRGLEMGSTLEVVFHRGGPA